MLNILYGIIAILIGIFMIWSTAKMSLTKSNYRANVLFKGYGAGIGFVIIGMVLIIKQILQ